MEQAMYMQVVPNSHRWTDLRQVLTTIEYDERRREIKSDDYIYSGEPLTVEYLLIGFRNTLKDRTRMVLDEKKLMSLPTIIDPIFISVEDIIEYLELYDNETKKILEEWSLERFKKRIEDTINAGFNLKKERKMERHEVYKCIDTERDYQDLRWTPRRDKNGTPDEQKPPAEWINYIEYHVTAAKNEVYFLNDEAALAQIRKVAALAVRCLELHGCPERVIPKELLSQK